MVRLRWTDILWDKDKMIIHSPKTEGYDGRDTRVVPLFQELRQYLNQAWETEADQAEFVITRYRDDSQNLRTTFLKIIQRAGLQPWPKLFQNMRASRQTELEETFPTHVVCQWMGNSPKVAQKHYLQVTDAHFEKAVQNPVQQASAGGRSAPHRAPTDPKKSPENAEIQHFQGLSINPARTRTGAQNTEKMTGVNEGGAKSGALDIQGCVPWREIRQLILLCDDLPNKVRTLLVSHGDESVTANTSG